MMATGSSRNSPAVPARSDSVSVPAANSTALWSRHLGIHQRRHAKQRPQRRQRPQLVAGEVGLKLGLGGQSGGRVLEGLVDQPLEAGTTASTYLPRSTARRS